MLPRRPSKRPSSLGSGSKIPIRGFSLVPVAVSTVLAQGDPIGGKLVGGDLSTPKAHGLPGRRVLRAGPGRSGLVRPLSPGEVSGGDVGQRTHNYAQAIRCLCRSRARHSHRLTMLAARATQSAKADDSVVVRKLSHVARGDRSI